MPPWPGRLFSSPATTNAPSQTSTEGSARAGTTSHARSTSSPFPFMFGKRSDKGSSRGKGFGALDSSDEEEYDIEPSRRGEDRFTREGGPEVPSGRCMTCDYVMRWPKELHVVRCTICMMVNDLKPRDIGRAEGNAPSSDSSSNPRPGQVPRPCVPSLSLQQTRSIIDGCVTRYLEARRAERARSVAGVPELTPNSPSTTEFVTAHGGVTVPHVTEALSPKSTSASTSLAPMPSHLSAPLVNAENLPESSLQQRRASFGVAGYVTSPDLMSPPARPPWRGGFENAIPPLPTRPPPPPPVPRFQLSEEDCWKFPSDRAPVSSVEGPDSHFRPRPPPLHYTSSHNARRSVDWARNIFRPLEDYIVTCFESWDCINSAFLLVRPGAPIRSVSEGSNIALGRVARSSNAPVGSPPMSDLDAKTLLLGDVAENGSWWAGQNSIRRHPTERLPRRIKPLSGGAAAPELSSYRTPRINWDELTLWYDTVLRTGWNWKVKWREMGDGQSSRVPDDMADIEDEMGEARVQVQNTLIEAVENLLKRPGRPLKRPEDVRGLFILLTNPLLFLPLDSRAKGQPQGQGHQSQRPTVHGRARSTSGIVPEHPRRGGSQITRHPSRAVGQHSGIIKRILGLLAHLPIDSHSVLITWFSQLSESHFRRLVRMVNGFLAYRLSRQQNQQEKPDLDPTAGLVPSLTGPTNSRSALLTDALWISGSGQGRNGKRATVSYDQDWQIKAAARVMAMLFAANTSGPPRIPDHVHATAHGLGPPSPRLARPSTRTYHQLLHLREFYNTAVDKLDVLADFDVWDSAQTRFTFCQYPFFLSLKAKMRIMEYDAKKQMTKKAREAYIDSVMQRRVTSLHLLLKVRRDCLVEDSLKRVSEVVGAAQDDIKKGLRIEFIGEEGFDAGGLRKEWFHLMVKEVFDPSYGLFVYEEDSPYCYFNPHCFETSDQFHLVGVLLGLAIYNQVIIDAPLPRFAFRRLLPAGTGTGPTTALSRSHTSFTLDDLAEINPGLARGLKQLLDFEGDVESTFCRTFVASVNRYGEVEEVPLFPGGENQAVTESNRQEFVDRYLHYLLDTAVSRQFEPFKRGFNAVCTGNALSLLGAEEIEVLIRGSDVPLDVCALRKAASYDGRLEHDPEFVGWLWDVFERADPAFQRRVLTFITGSDRIPALGPKHLHIRVNCLGDDCERFPVASTCFNVLSVPRYGTREKLEAKLRRAVVESEGFGLR